MRTGRDPFTFEAVETPGGFRGHLYKVSRPGRSLGPEVFVPDDVVYEWIDGILDQLGDTVQPDAELQYICLLGWKNDGRSEIADFYDARGPWDAYDPAKSTKPLWEGFLNRVARGRIRFRVHHFPTTDHSEVPSDVAGAVASRITELLACGHSVLVGCSAAMGRTGEVLAKLKLGAA